MASPFLAGFATGAGNAATDYTRNQLEINKEKARQILAGLISGDITPASANPTNPVMSAGQSFLSKLTGQQAPQYELGGINRQMKEATMGETKARTALTGAQIEEIPSRIEATKSTAGLNTALATAVPSLITQRGAETKGTEATTKQTEKATEMANLTAQLNAIKATNETKRKNWNQQYEIWKADQANAIKEAENRSIFDPHRATIGLQVHPVVQQQLNKRKIELDKQNIELTKVENETDKKLNDLVNKVASVNSNPNSDQYQIGQTINKNGTTYTYQGNGQWSY